MKKAHERAGSTAVKVTWDVACVDALWLAAHAGESLAAAIRAGGAECLGGATRASGPLETRSIRFDFTIPAHAGLKTDEASPIRIVATDARRRELENEGPDGPVAVVAWPAVEQGTGAETHSDSHREAFRRRLTFGVFDEAHSLGWEAAVAGFRLAFDREDEVRLLLLPELEDAASEADGTVAFRHSPEVTRSAAQTSEVDVCVDLECDAAVRPWLGIYTARHTPMIVASARELPSLASTGSVVRAPTTCVPGPAGSPRMAVTAEAMERALLDVRGFKTSRAPLQAAAFPTPPTDYSAAVVERVLRAASHAVVDEITPVLTAWVSTWNTKCGIASHVRNQLASAGDFPHLILAAEARSPLGSDGPEVVRCWRESKRRNGLDRVAHEVASRGVSSVVIHFNWGFFNHAELIELVEVLVERRVVVFIDMHSTQDPPDGARLADLAVMLRSCDRVLAHGPADVDRLARVGIRGNVLLHPLGVITSFPSVVWSRPSTPVPLLATFGYSFPNKGLVEFVDAIALLRGRGFAARALMLNAEHPSPGSAGTVMKVRRAIADRKLDDVIEFRADYLTDERCVQLLSEADLIVNPYQTTGESASAAVRYSMTARRPLLVTPLPIFDDLGGAVFRSRGTGTADLADAIQDVCRQLTTRSERATATEAAAVEWLHRHDIAKQAPQLVAISERIRVNRAVHTTDLRDVADLP